MTPGTATATRSADAAILLPLEPGTKKCLVEGWTATPPPPMFIGPQHNIGRRLDDAVDLDMDVREARLAAPKFLPPTMRKHGRPSVGVTHYWFQAEGAVYETFADVVQVLNDDGKLVYPMLGEIRTGSSHQTCIPPSRIPISKADPTLEELRWFAGGDPSFYEFVTIRTAMVYTMTAALIARHYVADWELFQSLAGFLLRDLHLPDNVAERIITVAADIAEDEETSPRPTYHVKHTRARLDAGKQCHGGARVAELIGEHGPAVVAQIRKWCGQGASAVAHPLTEAGDAECFANLYRDHVRYDHRRGRWLVSDEASGIWIPDPVERLTQMAIGMARERQRQANTIENAEKKKAAWTWAFKGEGRGRINNTLALARSVPPIADPGEHWDEDPFLLGVQNGVVDLRTGHFRKGTAADRVTMRVRVAYDPSATCPLWLDTLAGIFAPPADTGLHDLNERQIESRRVIDFMQRAVGYSITGDCREECCFFPWGAGGNGKGVTMNTLGWLLGDYTDDMPYSTLERSERGSGIPNDIAKMVGKRFITCSEVNEFNLNEARLKALTGRDPMTARFLHHEFFTFIPVCKIWVSTNNKPKIVGQDDGIWRRIHLIPFTQTFEGRENKQLKDQLREELPGILNWVIEGAGLWLRDGLNPPDTVKVATATYRQESNPITPFVDACCIREETCRMQAAEAFKEYEKFCRDGSVEGWQRLTNKAFFKSMEQAFKADKTGRQVFYLGVGLKAPARVATATPAPEGQPIDDSMAANPETADEVPF